MKISVGMMVLRWSSPVVMIVMMTVMMVITLTGCQTSPTRVTQVSRVHESLLFKNSTQAIHLDSKTIIVDVRSPFEFAVSHIPGSINLRWEDFADTHGPFKGKMKKTKDLDDLVRRLALYGIGIDSQVIVVGYGSAGRGEEGRVAWSLLYLGLKDVQVVALSYFRSGLSNAEPAPRPNVVAWRPSPNMILEADVEEVKKAAAVNLSSLSPGVKDIKGAYDKNKIHLLDVRTRQEFFQKNKSGREYLNPELGALHMPWTHFLTSEGRPSHPVRAELESLGWKTSDRIIVLSHHGVRSGAVAFMLMAMGFENVANFTGGYQELLVRQVENKKNIKARKNL